MRVLYLKEKSRSGDRSGRQEKSRSGDRSYRGGVRRESPLGEVGIRGKSRSGDRSYRGGVRRERSPSGEVGIYGEVAIGRSLLQGRCQERGRHWGKHQGEVAIGRSLLQGRCQERVAIGGSWHLWRGRDREIAPTGEVSGESRHWGKSRSGDRSYRGGVRRESPLGEEVAIGRSLLQKT